jgi:hypothetical protein
MSLFKPVLVEHKTSLDSVTKVNGQYIIVVDTKEIYVDRLAVDGTVERVGVNRGNVFLQSNAPLNPVEGDIWLQTEAESATLATFIVRGPSFEPPVTFEYEEGMTWADFIASEYNINNQFYETIVGNYTLVSHSAAGGSPITANSHAVEAKELIVPNETYTVV